MRQREQGFTIIELIVVIAILAILAAVALPKFIDLTSEARTASLNGVRGGFEAGVKLAHAKWLAGGSTGTTVTLDGSTTVVVSATGWPTVDIANGAQDTGAELYGLLMSSAVPTNWTSGETVAAGAGTCTFTLAGTGGGTVTYNSVGGSVS